MTHPVERLYIHTFTKEKVSTALDGMGGNTLSWGSPSKHKGRFSQVSTTEREQLHQEDIDAEWALYTRTGTVVRNDKIIPDADHLPDELYVEKIMSTSTGGFEKAFLNSDIPNG